MQNFKSNEKKMYIGTNKFLILTNSQNLFLKFANIAKYVNI